MATRPPASTPATRASLLREVSKVSDQTLKAIADCRSVQDRLQEAQATKDALRQQMSAADAELQSVKAQRKAEQENDAELTGLQRAVSTVTVKRQRLIADAKGARKDRDAARTEEKEKLLFRLGAAVEVGRATGDLVIPGIPPWHPDVTALAVDAELLWKSASSQTEVVRDLVEAALACKDSELTPATGSEAATTAPPSLAAGCIYGTLGAKALAVDCEKALKALGDLERDRSNLLDRTQRMLAGVAAAVTCTEEVRGERPLSVDIDEAPLQAVAALLQVLETHLSMANQLCCASLRTAAPESSDVNIEGGGNGGSSGGSGNRSASGSMDSAREGDEWHDATSDG